jgi:hypothetical protein
MEFRYQYPCTASIYVGVAVGLVTNMIIAYHCVKSRPDKNMSNFLCRTFENKDSVRAGVCCHFITHYKVQTFNTNKVQKVIFGKGSLKKDLTTPRLSKN